ncbi:hypothetical protein EV194_11330 [Natronoflexus pectinivorans]|uniref:Uncharacterized protein n=1 Tax=Natronoflexus pectinivorans TaxID=682526 RepID=A0A4R2GDE9_9BACT|nr:hypothetical protein EV194_11330 [Natronoflexus pectinivorans]
MTRKQETGNRKSEIGNRRQEIMHSGITQGGLRLVRLSDY